MPHSKHRSIGTWFLWGFLFGTLGLWALAALSLGVPFVETVTAPLFLPGRTLAKVFFFNNGSSLGDLGVSILTLLSGLFYGIVFLAVAASGKKRQEGEKQQKPDA
jgi:hypothetical protein